MDRSFGYIAEVDHDDHDSPGRRGWRMDLPSSQCLWIQTMAHLQLREYPVSWEGEDVASALDENIRSQSLGTRLHRQ